MSVLTDVEMLQKDKGPMWINTTQSVGYDTQTNSSLPNNTYGSSQNLMLGDSSVTHARLLMNVALTTAVGGPMPSTAVVSEALLSIYCVRYPNAPSERTMVYPARLLTGFDEANATHNLNDTNSNWSVGGADDEGVDRGAWEPPTQSNTASGWVDLNVTAIVQQALADGDSNFSVVISAVGIPLVCKSTEHPTTALRPELDLTYAIQTTPASGSLVVTSPEDGEVLADSTSLAIAPDTTPEIAWDNFSNGDGVVVQYSTSPDYRSNDDGASWHWNSWDNSGAFTISGIVPEGTFETPNAGLGNSTWVFYRMRVANGAILGPWIHGYFATAADIGAVNSNGDIDALLRNDTVGLGIGTVHDTWVTSGNTSFNGYDDTRMLVGNSNNSSIADSVIHIRVNMGSVALHDSASILDATLNLRRTGRNGEPIVSVYIQDNSSSPSFETMNWTHDGKGNTWQEGGISYSDDFVQAVDGNQSFSTLSFDVTTWLQQYLWDGRTDDIDFLIRAEGLPGEWVEFASGSEPISYRPHLDFTYTWGDSVPTYSTVGVTPEGGQASWEMTDWNLSSTVTPTLSWNATAAGSVNDLIIQMATSGGDPSQSITTIVDSRVDSGFNLNAGTYTVPSSWNVPWSEKIWWRIQIVSTDDERGPFNTEGFFTTTVNSTYLGNSEHELRYRHANGSGGNLVIQSPNCGDTYIEGGTVNSSNFESSDIIVSSTQVGLLGCQLQTHKLPDGLAVVSATLRLRTDPQGGLSQGVPITVHESQEMGWKPDAANWNTYDGTNSWNGAGASGTERVQSLDTTTVSSDGTWYEWNVTSALQKSARWGLPANFIITGSSTTAVLFSDNQQGVNGPELVVVYTNGSSSVPVSPIGLSPSNGEWTLSGDVTFAVDQTPTFSWNASGTPPADRWEVQMDAIGTMDSAEMRHYTSWGNSSLFSGGSLSIDTALDNGQVWYWRVRGLTSTGQVGNWSAVADFVIPDLTSVQIDTDTYEFEMWPEQILPADNFPQFSDTWVTGLASARNDSHAGEHWLFASGVGPANALISMPIDGQDGIPHPTGARLIGATFSIYVIANNTTDPRVSVHEILQDWNESATGVTYDGTNNWSSPGGAGAADRSSLIDVSSDTDAGIWLDLDITEIVQGAIARGEHDVSLMLSVDPSSSQSIIFASSDYPWQNSHPHMTLRWRNGSGSAVTTAASLVSPADGELIWDTSQPPALLSSQMPTLNWSHAASSSITDWRLFFYNDTNDERDGFTIHDSRYDQGFDVANMEWTPTSDMEIDEVHRWFVQPISDDMLGARSSTRTFIIPNEISGTINSTHAWINLKQGSASSTTGDYNIYSSAGLDECLPNTAQSLMYVGYSPSGGFCSANGYEWRSLLTVDISQVPIPEPWQVTHATIEMYRNAGNVVETPVSVQAVHCDWNATATWNTCRTGLGWQSNGASGNQDADLPIDVVIVNNSNWYSWDITQLVQQARISGNDKLNLIFRSEDPDLNAYHQFIHPSASGFGLHLFRPMVNITMEVGTDWAPDDATGLTPASTTTMWDSNSLLPAPLDQIELSWAHSHSSNVSFWEIEISNNARFADDVYYIDSSNSSTYNGTFSMNGLTYTTPTGLDWPDAWQHWRVRAIIDDDIGNWTNGGKWRVPADFGTDDGAGNYTVEMERGYVFEDSGLLPTMPDTWIGSSTIGVTQNHGAANFMYVGQSPSSATSSAVSLIEIDLTEYPYPTTMLPTNVTLELYVAGITGTGAHSISVHSCNSWSEYTVKWSNFNPNTECNGNASASMTSASASAGVWYQWDVTSLARDSWAGNGVMSLGLMSNWSGTVTFVAADYNQLLPKLTVNYVDNPNGAVPPAQVTLLSPDHLSAVYAEDPNDENLIVPDLRPILSWTPLSDATGYVLQLSSTTCPPFCPSETYQSWDSTGANFNISSSSASWTPEFDLNAGEIYSWNVRAINGSIPGATSVTWTFGIGDPNNWYSGNYVYGIEIIEGADVSSLSLPNVEDSFVSAGSQGQTSGTDVMEIGVGCDGSPGNTNNCIGIYSVDMSQLPLTEYSDVNPHSASLELYMNQITYVNQASYLDLTAYQLLDPNFDEMGASWTEAAIGVDWNTAGGGMIAGVDYSTTPLDSVRISNSMMGGWISFDISGAMTTANGSIGVVIIGTVPTGQMLVDVLHSESTSANLRPILTFNYTTVDSIAINGPSSTDADTGVSFAADLYDTNNQQLSGSVEWSSSDGTIDSNGWFTPDHTGQVNITAGYGQVQVTHTITVTSGAPVNLVIMPVSFTLTADESLVIPTVEVQDLRGNAVSGQVITFAITNGTLAPSLSVTTPVSSMAWVAWATGPQWINATWGTQSITITVNVLVGAPDYFIIDGCDVVIAAESCQYNWTLYDMHDNEVPDNQSGSLTWGVDSLGGAISPSGLFIADQVGDWDITLSSDGGMTGLFSVEVDHGAIADLEVVSISGSSILTVLTAGTLDSLQITADDQVTLTITRIDIRGNRLQVDLPITSFTMSNGTIDSGPPSVWSPWRAAPQWVEVTLEGKTTRSHYTVLVGAPVAVEARTDSIVLENGLISGDAVTIEAFAIDAHGNQWSEQAESWSIITPGSESSWLEQFPTYAEFSAARVGDWTVRLVFVWNGPNGVLTLVDQVTITVMPGPLHDITVAQSEVFITADDSVDMDPAAFDWADNVLPVESLTWWVYIGDPNTATTECTLTGGWTDISTEIRDANYIWNSDASALASDHVLCAAGPFVEPAKTIVHVAVGEPIEIWHNANLTYEGDGTWGAMADTEITAGETPFVEVWVRDGAGNEYQVLVNWDSTASDWSEEGCMAEAGDDGNHRFQCFLNQSYDLTYSHGTLSGVWNVHVKYDSLFRISAEASAPGVQASTSIQVPQRTVVTVTIEGFDKFGNQVPVTSSSIMLLEDSKELNLVTEIDATNYEVYMLLTGTNTFHMTSGTATDKVSVNVDSTLPGFYEANSPWSWVGTAVLLGIIISLVVFLVIVARRRGGDDEDDDYDDYEDDYLDEEYEMPSAPSRSDSFDGESYTSEGAGSDEQEEQLDTGEEEDPNYKVDEDGTEWWQDDEGVWWYREPDMDDWAEWTE